MYHMAVCLRAVRQTTDHEALPILRYLRYTYMPSLLASEGRREMFLVTVHPPLVFHPSFCCFWRLGVKLVHVSYLPWWRAHAVIVKVIFPSLSKTERFSVGWMRAQGLVHEHPAGWGRRPSVPGTDNSEVLHTGCIVFMYSWNCGSPCVFETPLGGVLCRCMDNEYL